MMPKYPLRVSPVVDFGNLTAAERERSVKMGRHGRPSASNVMRTLLRFPNAQAMSDGISRRQGWHDLTMRQYQLVCQRTLWFFDCEYLWSRHRLSAVHDGIDDQVLLAIAEGPANTRLQGEDRLFAYAADELYHDHRLSDESWDAMRARHPEAPVDVVGIFSQYVMMAGFANSVGTALEEGVPGYTAEIAELANSRAGRGGRSAGLKPTGDFAAKLDPIPEADFTTAQVSALKTLGGDRMAGTDMIRTFLHSPSFVVAIGSFIARQRECLLPERLVRVGRMRTAWIYDCETLWAQEAAACRELGMSEAEIHEIAADPRTMLLAPTDILMARAIDELHHEGRLSDASWTGLLGFGEEAPLDAIGVLTLGVMISTMANTLHVQLEAGATGFSPELRARMK